MNITEVQIYWIERLDAVSNFFSISAVLLSLAFVVVMVWFCAIRWGDAYNHDEEEWEKARKASLRMVITNISLMLFCILGSVFTPTTNQMYKIKLIPVLANSEAFKEASKTPEKFFKTLNDNIDDLGNKIKEGRKK